MNKKHIVTIAGRPGSGKSTTAKIVAKRLGFKHFSSGDLFRAAARERGIDILQANLTSEQKRRDRPSRRRQLREIGATEDNEVIDSRTAWHWMPGSFKVFLDLDLEVAAKRIIDGMDELRLANEHVPRDPAEYAKKLQKRLDSEARRYSALYQINPYDMSNYDLVIDTAANDIEQTVELVTKSFQSWVNQ